MTDIQSYNVNMHILSPVHIGAGQELDPFSYLVKEQNILLFDLLCWMEGYENKEELNKKMDSEDYIALRAYIAQNFNNDNAVLCSIPVKSPEIITRYKRAMRDKKSENQALVNFMTRNDITRTPYIPGSSIKGAIRTAIASHFAFKANVTRNDKRYRKYEEKIFGKTTRDPMKNLKISDVSLESLENHGSFIYEAKEFSCNQDKTPTPKGGFEASASLCELGSQVVIPLHFSLKNFHLHGQKIDLKSMVEMLYEFYMPKYKDEYKKFYHSSKEIQKAISYLNEQAITLKTNEVFIRIGHFSHIECMTIDKLRDPKTRKQNGHPLPWGTTRTLANGLYPFGWVKLEFKDLSSSPMQDTDWPFPLEKIKQDIKLRNEAKIIAVEKQKEEAEKEEARKKRQAELDAMSPEDKMIKEVKAPNTTENRVYEIYHAIDSFPEEKKIELANALKIFWQKKNKWKKKKCSQKQWDKVFKIKEILDEN